MLAVTEGFIGYAALAAVVVLTFISLRSTHRKQRGRSSPQHSAEQHIARLREPERVSGDVQQLLVELQELSRQINAQIETRFAKLEASIRTADDRIDTLQRLLRSADGQPTIDTVVGGKPQSDEPQQPPRQPEAAAAGAAPSPPAGPDEPVESERDTVYRLADAGRSPVEIAQLVGRSNGEIELILALRPIGNTPPAGHNST